MNAAQQPADTTPPARVSAGGACAELEAKHPAQQTAAGRESGGVTHTELSQVGGTGEECSVPQGLPNQTGMNPQQAVQSLRFVPRW